MKKVVPQEKQLHSPKKATPRRKPPEKKPTHLFLHDKNLVIINNLSYDNLTTLYLHNNKINRIKNLDSAINLNCLYLQNNRISKIENLQCLRNLKKLYLGQNEISVVEGLETLEKLIELHVEKQRLSKGDSLCFDLRTLSKIGETLEVLNVSHNNIGNLLHLSALKRLKKINASLNQLTDIRELCDTVINWYYLDEANFIGNPVTKRRLYRESLISYTCNLSLLDNKEIRDTTRTFIKRLEQEKLNQTSKHSINLADKLPEIAKSYPLPVQKAVSRSILMKPKPSFDDATIHSNVNDIYLPWNALPKSVTHVGIKSTDMRKKEQPRKVSAFTFGTFNK